MITPPQRKAPCPLCGKRVKVHDPGPHATPWLAAHRDGKVACPGSRMAAPAPRPPSDAANTEGTG